MQFALRQRHIQNNLTGDPNLNGRRRVIENVTFRLFLPSRFRAKLIIIEASRKITNSVNRKMENTIKINSVNPQYAIPGGEIVIECSNFRIGGETHYGCYFDGEKARIVGASNRRIVAIVPEEFLSETVSIVLEAGEARSEPFEINVGRKLADDMHIVANPAVDPTDDAIILTRSGTRGQELPVTMFRLEKDGFLDEMPVEVMNPTGLAFDSGGKLFVTSRLNGEVVRINEDYDQSIIASDLGIATGIAFDSSGTMYVGDRSGTIYKISEFGISEIFAAIEPSVAAYHMAFGADGKLYVAAPGLASYDVIYAIDKDGFEEVFFRGLGRPQGLAFDSAGNLYVAASYQSRRGIIKISPLGTTAEVFVAGMNVVGLCFTKQGEMIVATNEAIYSLPMNIQGTLLSE